MLGLRARVIAAFCLGSFVLSILVAVISYSSAREYLMRQREASAVRQAGADAAVVMNAVDPAGGQADQILDSLRGSLESEPVLRLGNRWYAAGVGTGRDALPKRLRDEVDAGSAVKQRIELDGAAALAVGVPLADHGAYFEIFPLTELDDTLTTLRTTLAAAAAAAAAIGAFGGWLVARRLMAPLQAVTETSRQLAEGHLDMRLDGSSDPELSRVAEAYNSMADALQQRIERDSRFAADVSHELRSPLTTLETSLTVMERRRDQLPDRARQALDNMSSEVRRFQAIVLDLLEISRAESGPADAPALEMRVAELLVRSTGDIPVQVETDAARAAITGDKRRLERMITNLVDNADKYAGGATSVGLLRNGDCVRIVVDDAGPGVPPEDRERVFERFSRGRSAGQRGTSTGGGLGLAIVREHARALGGSAWVEDAPSGGARFVVELPVTRWV